MNIKLDENIPHSLTDDLKALDHSPDHVKDEKLTGHPDRDVWERAQKEDRFFITQNLDFSDIREHPPGTHSGLLLVRLRIPGRKALRDRILQVFQSEPVTDRSRKFVVLTEMKLRVHDTMPEEDST